MSLSLTLSYGTTTLDLNNPSATAYAEVLQRAYYTPTAAAEESETTAESFAVKIIGTSASHVGAKIQAINSTFRKAREYQETHLGDPVYANCQPAGYTHAWRSEVRDGRLELSPDSTLWMEWGTCAWGVVSWERKNYWEGTLTPVSMSNLNGTIAGTAGTIAVYNNNSGTTSGSYKEVNYVTIAGTAVTGDLPAPVKICMNGTPGLGARIYAFGNVNANPGTLTCWWDQSVHYSGTSGGGGGTIGGTTPTLPTINYFVATNGNDTNSGTTTAAPFRTIAKGISVLTAGKTLAVRAGTYNERMTFNASGTTNSMITVMAYPGESVVIDGGGLGAVGGTGDYSVWLRFNSAYCQVDGFEIRNTPGHCVYTQAGSHNNVVKNCYIHHIMNTGFLFGGTYGTIDNCRITQTAYSASPAYRNHTGTWGAVTSSYKGAAYNTVKNCLIYKNQGEGVNLLRSDHMTVQDNVIYDAYAPLVYLDNATNSVVQRNFIYNSGDTAFYHSDGPTTGIYIADEEYGTANNPGSARTIINNIVAGLDNALRFGVQAAGTTRLNGDVIAFNTFAVPYGPTSYNMVIGTAKGQPHANTVIKNNIFYPSVGYNVSIASFTGLTLDFNNWPSNPGGSYAGANDVYGDPEMLNPHSSLGGGTAVTPDWFSISSNSICLAEGTPISGATVDYYGATRSASTPSIGATEYLGTSVVPPGTAGGYYTINAGGEGDLFLGDLTASYWTSFTGGYFKVLLSAACMSVVSSPVGQATFKLRPYVRDGFGELHYGRTTYWSPRSSGVFYVLDLGALKILPAFQSGDPHVFCYGGIWALCVNITNLTPSSASFAFDSAMAGPLDSYLIMDPASAGPLDFGHFHFDGIEGFNWLFMDGGHDNGVVSSLRGVTNKLLLYPGQLQRIYFRWGDTTSEDLREAMYRVAMWYRPRKLTL